METGCLLLCKMHHTFSPKWKHIVNCTLVKIILHLPPLSLPNLFKSAQNTSITVLKQVFEQAPYFSKINMTVPSRLRSHVSIEQRKKFQSLQSTIFAHFPFLTAHKTCPSTHKSNFLNSHHFSSKRQDISKKPITFSCMYLELLSRKKLHRNQCSRLPLKSEPKHIQKRFRGTDSQKLR